MIRALGLGVVLAGAAAAEEAPIPAGRYEIDPLHASLIFTVSHLGFSNYTAGFDRFNAELALDPEASERAELRARIDVTSLDLPGAPVDFLAVMLGEAWFHTDAFPDMTYESQRIVLTGETTADIEGLLTLRGITQPVTLSAVFNGGYAHQPFEPRARIGFSATGTLSRTAFGMGFGVPPGGSDFGVGDDVAFRIEVEFSGPPASTE